MRIAVMGSDSQLGRQVPAEVRLSRRDYDLADRDSIHRALDRQEVDGVVLTAAYTDVDGCESNRDHAFAVNGRGPGEVASWCSRNGAWMVYVSSNCVFDGQKAEPYLEGDAPNPISVYGSSKLAGELAVRERLLRYYVVRTSWVFGPGGNNFVTKALGWARSQPSLKGAADEIACPTSAEELGPALVKLGYSRRWGVYHLTNEGACSRYELLKAIVEMAGYDTPVEPARLADFPRPSSPPLQSALANVNAAALGVTLGSWQLAVGEYVKQLVPTLYAAR